MTPQRLARLIARLRWPIVIAWIVVGILAVRFLPQLSTVVAQQDALTLPRSASYEQAQRLVSRIDPAHPAGSSMLVAIVRKGGLTSADQSFFREHLAKLAAQASKHGISFIQDRWTVQSGAAAAFLSRDRSTEIALVGFHLADVNPATSRALKRVEAGFYGAPAGLRVYYTGDVPIMQDNIQISQAGVNRTAAVTVVLVLAILVLVLRSALAPLINLFTIGLSFLITSGVDAYLGRFGLPLTTFTQTFLIAVLFGAGTDYAIILLNRFREELQRDGDGVEAAIARTFAGAGRTVLFSALTVLVSFATLYFAQFSLYRSGTGVAVGIAVTLLACLTLIPALMAIFGRRLFWPRPPQVGEGTRPLGLWTFSGRIATAHPWWTALALVAVLTPIALLYTGQRSFNTLHQIPQAASVQGFHAVAGAFGEGKVMPVQIVLRTPRDLRTPQGLATIDAVTSALAAQRGVSEVESATWPVGRPIPEFTLADQTGKVATGLGSAVSGAEQLASGLAAAKGKLEAAAGASSRLQAAAENLVNATPTLQSGLLSFAQGASSLGGTAGKLGTAAGQLASGETRLAQAAGTLATSGDKLATGLAAEAKGSATLAQGLTSLSASQTQLGQAAESLTQAIAAWAAAHPGTAASPDWQSIASTATRIDQGLQQSQQGTAALAQGAQSSAAGAGQLASGAQQLAQGLSGLAQGNAQAAKGMQGLARGVQGVDAGLGKLAGAGTKLATGAGNYAQATGQISRGLAQASQGAGQLTPGLAQAAQAAGQLGSGVHVAQVNLAGMAAGAQSSGFYVPASAMGDRSLAQAMQSYISPDGHVAMFTVDLAADPYSSQAIERVPVLVSAAQHALRTSPVRKGTFYAGGQSGLQASLSQLSSHDFNQTAILVLGAIFLLLVILLRSLIMPAFIIASLYATYEAAMGLGQLIFVDVLHHTGVYWVLPFFVLLLLVALGVDYAIFLMSRFEEMLRARTTPAAAIRQALGRMGQVILSAAVIMAGTFGSMAASGVTSLTELGVVVVLGLFLYTFVLLGFFVPAAIAIVGWGLRWPFASGRPRALRPRHRYPRSLRGKLAPAPGAD